MKNIAIFTTTRAEYGLLKPLIRAVDLDSEMNLLLFVGGTHLAQEHGKTIKEINNDGFKITATFDYLLNTDSTSNLIRSMGIESFQLAEIFEKYPIDVIVILGDRFELIPIVLSAILSKSCIAHLNGGEATEGLIDEQIRHMVTKAAHLHFPSCEEYRRNIIRMGEESYRVFNVGALSIDNILMSQKKSKEELFKKYDLDVNQKTVLLTYHPVTLEFNTPPVDQIRNLFDALLKSNLQIIITAPNMEVDREIIISEINKIVNNNSNIHYIESLGIDDYQSMLNYVEFVIGNSSSGIIEAPYFKIPSINIGARQKGRIRHKSVIDVNYSVESIKQGIKKALDPKFRESLKTMKYKFGDGHAAERIVEILKKIEINQNLLRKKLEFPQ